MPDNLTATQRSFTMSRIRSSNTQIELHLRRRLHRLGLRYRLHSSSLPGKPDIVFSSARVVVLVDGDFWHGWRFTKWQHKLAPYWRQKIAGNIKRDTRTRARLRRLGWNVVRIWEHELRQDPDDCVRRVVKAVSHGRRRALRKSAKRPKARAQTR
jgi:DNA mismatch endonuclease, patch repair protein